VQQDPKIQCFIINFPTIRSYILSGLKASLNNSQKRRYQLQEVRRVTSIDVRFRLVRKYRKFCVLLLTRHSESRVHWETYFLCGLFHGVVSTDYSVEGRKGT
jgi:hypothetical protein